MPEVDLRILWPDGAEETCRSPSTILRDYFAAGESYSVAEFLRRSREGFAAASDRVEAKFGFACSAARAELDRIEAAAERYDREEGVTCLSMS